MFLNVLSFIIRIFIFLEFICINLVFVTTFISVNFVPFSCIKYLFSRFLFILLILCYFLPFHECVCFHFSQFLFYGSLSTLVDVRIILPFTLFSIFSAFRPEVVASFFCLFSMYHLWGIFTMFHLLIFYFLFCSCFQHVTRCFGLLFFF